MNISFYEVIYEFQKSDYRFRLIFDVIIVVRLYVRAPLSEFLVCLAELLSELLDSLHDVKLQPLLQLPVPNVLLVFVHQVIVHGRAVLMIQGFVIMLRLFSLGGGVSAMPPFNVLDNIHGEELVLEAVVNLNEVLKITDEIDWQRKKSVQVGTFEERYQIERDKLQTIDL